MKTTQVPLLWLISLTLISSCVQESITLGDFLWKTEYKYLDNGNVIEIQGRDLTSKEAGEDFFQSSIISWTLDTENSQEGEVLFTISSSVNEKKDDTYFSILYFATNPEIVGDVNAFSSSEEKLEVMEKLLLPGSYELETNDFRVLVMFKDQLSIQSCADDEFVSFDDPENNIEILNVEKYEHPLFGTTLRVHHKFSISVACSILQERYSERIQGEMISFYQPCLYNSGFNTNDCSF